MKSMPVHRVAPGGVRTSQRVKSMEAGFGAEDTFQEMAQRLIQGDRSSVMLKHPSQSMEESFVKRIKKRECIAFVSKDGSQDDDSICQCGNLRSWHDASAYTHRKCHVPWMYNTHTQLLPTDAYGQIEFVGFRQKIAEYIRVDVHTSMDKLLELLTNVWHISPPNMLITVTGGAKTFKLKPRLKDMFRKGLMRVAHTTSAWIVSGGMYAGVMRLVGEAVRDFDLLTQNKAVAIGIAPWGCVQNNQALLNCNRAEGETAQYSIERDIPLESPIDPNHTHFIFVDNGTTHKFGTEISLRAKLEEAVSSSMSTVSGGSDTQGVKVPTVMVVLEGGPGTLETVYQAIQKGTPAVIVEGSGRAADILAYAYTNAHEEEVTVTDQDGKQFKKKIMGLASDIEADVSTKISDAFGDKALTTWVGWVKESIQKYDLLTVFQLDSEDSKDLDISILHALLKANKEQRLDQLQLALSWDRIDVAKTDIFGEDSEWKPGELNNVMMSAILLDRVEFVDLFLDNGVSLKHFLTIDKLLTLYNQCRQFFTLEDVGRLIKSMIGDFYEPLYLTNSNLRNAIPSALAGQNTGENDVIKRPERELFVWSVLMNRREMALYFWNSGKDPLCAALFANKILKSLMSRTFDTDLKSFTAEHAKLYEDLGIGVLTECHNLDERQARMLLVRNLEYWGNTTCLVMAVEARNKQFIAHPACQSLLNTIWYSHLSFNNYFFMILLAALVPPLIFSLKFVRSPGFGEQEAVTVDKDEQSDPHNMETIPEMKEEGMEMVERSESVASLEEESPRRVRDIPKFYDQPRIGIFRKIAYFFKAPIVRFSYNVLFYIMFLLLYSYHLLIELNPVVPPKPIEYVIIVWVVTIIIEEMRQFITSSKATIVTKAKNYIHDQWNIADLITILLFLLALVLRFVALSGVALPATSEAARIVFAINIITFYLRLLHIFSVNKNLGPKLVMIGKMIVDLLYFFGILMVFVVSYGIATQSLLAPNAPFHPIIIIDVLQKAYFQIFGELFLDDIKGTKIESVNITVPIMLGFYMLLTNVLLLNLLIAMFSYTFTAVQENTDIHWYFQRYSLIYEYYERPFFPPPFIVISHLFRLIKYVSRCCKTRKDDGFSKTFDTDADDNNRAMSIWEDRSRDDYNRKQREAEMKSVDYVVSITAEKVNILHARMDLIQEQQQASFSYPGGQMPVSAKMPKELDKRLTRVEDHIAATFESLNYLVKSLSENNLASKTLKPPTIPDIKKEKQLEKKRAEETAEREKEMVKKMIEKRVQIHAKSRVSPYPESQVLRFPVPDEKVPWEISFSEYNPVAYTDNKVLKKPAWADPIDLLQLNAASRPMLSWHKYDSSCQTDRTSYLGEYEIHQGLPINPKGRTGIVGRGLLGRWGPNHAGDPVVTRWKRDTDGNKIMEEGKPLLEFAAIQRRDNRQWSFPGGICPPGADVSQTLKKEFTDEAMAGDTGSVVDKQKLDELFTTGTEVFKGYADDPRNTDNAWIETRVVHYHDETGEILRHIKLRAGVTEILVTWLTASSKISMYGSHQYFMQKVVNKMKCAF